MTMCFHLSLLSKVCSFKKRFHWLYTVQVELAYIQMPASAGGSFSYLNLAKLSHSDFLYLQDKEVPNIGAITELTNMKMEIKEPSSAYGQVCGRWTGTCTAILLAESLLISGSLGPRRLPSLSFNGSFQRDLPSCQTFTWVIWVCVSCTLQSQRRSDTVVKECLCDYWRVGMRLAVLLNEKER